jgi:hypothetical protein
MDLTSTPGIEGDVDTPVLAAPDNRDDVRLDDVQSPIAGFAQAKPSSDAEQKSALAASEMQLWWREGSGATGYQNVAVLLIKWVDELDQLKCGDEVSDVRS